MKKRHIATLALFVLFALLAAGSGGNSKDTDKDLSSSVSIMKASDGFVLTNKGDTIHNARLHINSDFIYNAGNIPNGVSKYRYTMFKDGNGSSFASSRQPVSRISLLSDDGRAAWK